MSNNTETMESVVKEKVALESVVKSLDEKIASYESLGTPEDINTAFEQADALLTKLEDLGTPEQIEKAIDLATSALESYAALGTPEEISKAFDIAIAEKTTANAESLSREFGIDIVAARDMLGAYENFDKTREVISGLMKSKKSPVVETYEVETPVGGKTVGRLATLSRGL